MLDVHPTPKPIRDWPYRLAIAIAARWRFAIFDCKPMGLKPLFNGNDLSRLEQGPRREVQVRSDERWRAASHQRPRANRDRRRFHELRVAAECKVNGDGLNSGMFFRTLREGRWAGYESQINNEFKDGDRTKPKDFGTGGIYRRQPARCVVAERSRVVYEDDRGRWAAYGGVGEWVSGERLDRHAAGERKCPRRATRLGGGAIAIQGHDATTDFLFRNIRAVELPR